MKPWSDYSATRIGVVALCLCAAIPVPALSQNLNPIFNLMGRVIENDMQRQELQRQRSDEQKQRALEEQRQRSEEQARIDAEREREIALTKRMQTALSALGFYKSKIDGDRGAGTRMAEAAFAAAFGIPSPSLTDADVGQVEYYAAAGFRSRDEMTRASQGGFGSRKELVDAEAGGFSNASEMAAAHQAGFQMSSSFAAFQRSGFKHADDFRAADRGGFVEPAEFAAAKAAGFAERDEYREFVRSGLADRAAYEANQRAAAACKKRDGDLIAGLDSCLLAVSVGARGTDVAAVFEALGRRLQARRAELAAGTLGTEVAGTAAVPSAGTFLQDVAAVDAAIKRYQCGLDVLRSTWSDAAASCQQTDSASDKVVASLSAEAAKNAEAERQKIAADEEARRVAAEAERSRLALETAHARVAALIENLTAFMQSKRELTKPLDVAKAFVALKQQKDATDFRPIDQALTHLEELLGAEADFQKFLEGKRVSEDIAKTNARATAEAEIRRMEAFIEQYVARNLLSDNVAELLALQSSLADARDSGQDSRILNGQKEAKAALERLGLSEMLAAYVPASEEKKPTDVQKARNGLALTAENRSLLEGDPKDILLLGNFTPKAPHLVLDLLGKTAFDGGVANYCWQGGAPVTPDIETRVVEALRRVGAEKVSAAANCNGTPMLGQDVIVLERGRFLQSDVVQASTLVEAFEKQDLKLLELIAWADVGNESQRDAQTAEEIKKEITAGLRSGFGFVKLDNGADGLCVAGKQETLTLHLHLFASKSSALARYLRSDVSPSVMSLERAFVGIQKQDCGLVYAEAADLKQLLQALDKAHITYAVLPVWMDDQEVAAAQKAIGEAEAAGQREIAAKQQQQEAQQTVAAKQAKDAEAVRAKAEADLRARYSEEAKAAFNRLSGMGEAYIRGHAADGDFASLFPSIAQWKNDRLKDGWEVEDYDGTLLDYGTANWQGRRAEAVFVQIIAKSKNALRGEYAQDCFAIGYLIDDEFSRLRDPVAATCASSSEQLSTWQTSRAFESRWVVR
ncbi:hypothetical protein [Mesorhizobium sp. CO1-1-8]|uniref:hypothetical protein n=1 Tax=Mesorhizobium sp. CO1-1-8 TaxID=2876631 RepID=UPI001CD141EF|nr:hypothetical protein [Mesorhizobium sp. CO1-1-8]MBZ9774068.1 hypothetical protein [Mesorhizobium sp. CO1-1-8]